jgi:hypothetical protein
MLWVSMEWSNLISIDPIYHSIEMLICKINENENNLHQKISDNKKKEMLIKILIYLFVDGTKVFIKMIHWILSEPSSGTLWRLVRAWFRIKNKTEKRNLIKLTSLWGKIKKQTSARSMLHTFRGQFFLLIFV